jgi:multidrug efflux system membrane fusion protein
VIIRTITRKFENKLTLAEFKMNKPIKINILLLIVFLLGGFIVSGCDREPPPEPLIRPVLTQQVEIKSYWQESRYAGEVQARYKMALGFRINGKIIERFVEIGDVVEPGALLARLDPQDYQLQLMEAQGGLAAAKAEKSKAASDLKRYEQLYKDKVVSATEWQNYSNVYAVANARYKQAEAQVDVARNQTEYTSLHTDKGGVITSLDMEVGQVVVAGQTVVGVALPQEKEVVIDVAENRLNEIRYADRIKISLWVNPDKFYKGKVREVSPGADPITRTYSVKITLLDADEAVHLGMTTAVLVLQKKQGEVARLPLTAIYQQNKKPAVWIFSNATSRVNLQPVKVTEYQYDAVLISDGLKQGEYVVIAGVHKLAPDQQVRLLPGSELQGHELQRHELQGSELQGHEL